MTDEEVKKMMVGLAVAQTETDRLFKELAQEGDRRQQEADRRQQKAERRHEETKALLEGLAQRADRRQTNIDRLLKSLADNIGGLSNKFGSFTEALAFPSMDKLLSEKFKMDFIAPDARKRREGRSCQIDVLAYSNTKRNTVFVVEIKSRLRPEDIDQVLNILRDFSFFFPEHTGKELYAMVAVVEADDTLRKKLLKQGIYLAQISDEVFQLAVPEDFEPRSFSSAEI